MKSLLILLLVLGLTGCGLIPQRNIETSNSVTVSPPETVIDPETGQIDEDKFEQSQELSGDDSLMTIEQELDNTVILEEDFSDLGI